MSPNPFFFGGAIRDARYFVGRRRELRRIYAALQHLPAQAQHVSVIGPRRMGKSSLLMRVHQLLPSRVPAARGVYLDGQSLRSPADFHRAWAAALGVATVALEQHLQFLRDQGQMVVLLLDELEALIEHGFPKDFFDRLRALMNDSRLAMVVAAKTPVPELVREQGLTSPFFNMFVEQIRLGPLPADEAEELLARGRTCDRPFTPEELAWLRRWARQGNGYHPARLQLAGFRLYEAKAHGPVDLAALERQLNAQWAAVIEARLPWHRRARRALRKCAIGIGRFVHETILRKPKGTTSESTLFFTGVIVMGVFIGLALALMFGLVPWEAVLAWVVQRLSGGQ